jgi:ferredoxin-NADP reductase/ferredoxin
LKVVSTHDESADVRSFLLGDMDDHPLPRFEAGQYVVLKFGSDGAKTFVRCYSLSGGVDTSNWRISVKRENHGQASSWLHEHLMAGNAIDVSAPRGNFLIEESEDPVVFLSAGIGITPLFSMLHSLTANDKAPQRKVYWIRAARDSHHDVFRDEVRTTLRSLPNAISHVAYSQPLPEDRQNVDFDLEGHLSVAVMESLGVPKQSEFYLCGPTAFLKDFHRELQQWGTFESRIHFESFGSNAITSGAVKRTAVAGSLTADRPMVTLSKSSVSLVWSTDCNNILELLESNKIPVQWSCRVGVCHACENTILDGSVTYSPQPLDPPGEGRVLLCCSQPSSDVVLDI